jgi:hypothetical protein
MADTHTDWRSEASEHLPAKNRIRVEGAIAYVELSQGLEATIDTCDIEIIAKHRWHVSRNIDGHQHARSNTGGRMHRLLTRAPDGLVVDHINHDPLDNRRANLRVVTQQHNTQNRKGANRNNHIGVRGVGTWKSSDGRLRYQARVYVDGKCHVRRFPYTDEGLQQAIREASRMRAELMPHSLEARTNG